MKRAAVRLTVLTGLLLGPPVLWAQGLTFYPVQPCRIVDTRNPPVPDGTGGPALANNQQRNFPIANRCGVPDNAQAAFLNLTIVQPTHAGHLVIWPYTTNPPLFSNLNYVALEPAIANGTVARLTIHPQFNISASAAVAQTPGHAHLIIDVTGYYAP